MKNVELRSRRGWMLLALALLHSSFILLHSQHLYINLVDQGLGLQSATNRTVLVTGNSLPKGVSSGVVLQDKHRLTTDVEGGCWISNAVPGVYFVDVIKPSFAAYPAERTTFYVLHTNTTGITYAREAIAANPGNTMPADSVAWGAATSDARFVKRAELTNLVQNIPGLGGGVSNNQVLTGIPTATNALFAGNFSGSLTGRVWVTGSTTPWSITGYDGGSEQWLAFLASSNLSTGIFFKDNGNIEMTGDIWTTGKIIADGTALSGTLTNNTTGNAATATTATNANTATAAKGLLANTTNIPIQSTWSAKRFPVPPRIWGSWNDHTVFPAAETLTENYILAQCDWYATNGMKAAGFNLIVLEEGWQGPALNADGTFTVTNRFPSGLAYLATEIKKRGFIPGIYTGIGANANAALTCMGFVGTCYTNLDKHVQQFADWGFEFIYFDACSGWGAWTEPPSGYTPAATGDWNALYTERANLVHQAVAKTRKNIATYVIPPGVSTAGPTAPVRVNPEATLRHSIFNLGDIYESGGLTWDYVPTSDINRIASFYSANLPNWQALNQPGCWGYGFIVNYSLSANAAYLSTAIQSMIPLSTWVTSTFMRRDTNNAPSTWDGATPNIQMTNQLAAAIHQDPACNPGQIVYTNHMGQAWVRQIGYSPAKSNALLLVNWATTNQVFNITNSWFSANRDDQLEFYSIWFGGTNLASSAGGVTQITVPTSNSVFALVVKGGTSTWRPYSFREVTLAGTGASINSWASLGPSPWFNVDGVSQSAGNQLFYWAVDAPPYATKCTMAFKVYSAGGAVAWTNTPGYDFYANDTRVQRTTANDSGVTATTVITTASQATWTTNVMYMVATNHPKVVTMGMGAGTNASARYIIGPMYIRWD